MNAKRERLLTQLGFRFGINGPHAARTMMLDDLRELLGHVPTHAARADYEAAIVSDNVLGKPTKKARELAFRHLVTLYGLDPTNPIFRALRRLWTPDHSAQSMLAVAVANARDPLLRGTQDFYLPQPAGTLIGRDALEAFLSAVFPDRFSPASLKSFAQNIAGTWTAAGVLHGRVKKIRAIPTARPESVAMLLFLGYLEGRSGQRLFTSDWIRLLNATPDELESLTSSASHRGLLVFLNAGGVKEVRFPDYLSPQEELIRQEVAHVV